LTVQPIDLHHQGVERSIGVYLLETPEGPALFDCGPSTALDALRRGLRERGLELTDVRHLLLSHIHLDHAGAAGVLVREHPELRVHVSSVGAPHLVEPSRLEASARRLYGDSFDTLWGELAPVPEENLELVGHEVLGLACFPTPGHAYHHVCYLDADGTLYSGDVCGVRIVPERLVIPPVPPPEVDVEAWDASLDEIERRAPERLALIHFGVVEDDMADHLRRLRTRLHAWEELIERGLSEQEFDEAMRADIAAELGRSADAYPSAAPPGAYQGLKRWAEKVKPSRSRASGAA
jgi:glyoxylase-like metal-dependent hydrolase (beta-lactamase superfamily II)